jgi:hypothetical protein
MEIAPTVQRHPPLKVKKSQPFGIIWMRRVCHEDRKRIAHACNKKEIPTLHETGHIHKGFMNKHEKT